jgi:hypothetical protein
MKVSWPRLLIVFAIVGFLEILAIGLMVHTAELSGTTVTAS